MKPTNKIITLAALVLGLHQAHAAQWQKIKDVSTKEWVTYAACVGCIANSLRIYFNAINAQTLAQSTNNKANLLFDQGKLKNIWLKELKFNLCKPRVHCTITKLAIIT